MISHNDSGPDHCIAFPLPTLLLIIVFHGIEIHHQWTVFPVRAQPQINAENEPIGSGLTDDSDKLAAKAHKKITIVD